MLYDKVQEPFEEQVVTQALAELALAADRVEGHQQARLEQVLGRDRGPAPLRVHGVEDRAQLGQRRVHDRLDSADGVLGGDQLVWRQAGQHGDLTGGATAQRGTSRATAERC